jgi:hypothetical protein
MSSGQGWLPQRPLLIESIDGAIYRMGFKAHQD